LKAWQFGLTVGDKSIRDLDSSAPVSYNEKEALEFTRNRELLEVLTMDETTDKKHEMDPRVQEVREHARAARNAMRKSLEAFLPAGYLENRRAARKEFLLAMRSLVDVAIDRVEKATED
jgi:hypothetical protein